MKTISLTSLVALLLSMSSIFISCSTKSEITPEEAKQIAKEAYIYGNPMVDSYRIIYSYFIDQNNQEYKAPFNVIKNIPKVYTYEDKAVQTPNSDTPYSMLGLDLRAEPIILTVPPIEKDRYFSIQLVDAYTFNFDYIGSRTTGNDGGIFLIAGPNWKGKVPEGINKVFNSETEFALAIYRTQLYNTSDLQNVINIQNQYKAQTLSEFLGQPSPAPAPKIDFLKPLTPEEQKTSLDFFKLLNFWLQFCPTNSGEKELMARFEKINVGASLIFDQEKFSPEIKQAIQDGITAAWKELAEFEKAELLTGKVESGNLFGTREYLKNNYLYRFAGAVLGIFGNSKLEAIYPIYKTDSTGNPLDGTSNKYVIQLTPDQLPPVNAFWSFTMYQLPASLLVKNPINRYLLNSTMLSEFKRNVDGGITLYIQNQTPGKDRESNWLPAPDGPFMVVLRLYWPKEEALNGTWKQPPMQLVKN